MPSIRKSRIFEYECIMELLEPDRDSFDFKPEFKTLPVQETALGSILESIGARIEKVKAFDGVDLMNAYCDGLNAEIVESSENAIAYINDQKVDLLNQVSAYRQILLDSNACLSSSKKLKRSRTLSNPFLDSFALQEVEHLSQKFNELNENLRTSISSTDKAVKKAEKRARRLERKLDELERSLKDSVFHGQTMRFERNQLFSDSTFQLGELVYDRPFQDASVKIEQVAKTEPSLDTNGSLKEQEFKSNPPTLEIETSVKHIFNSAESQIVDLLMSLETGTIRKMTFLENGNLASCSDDCDVRIWRIRDCDILHEFQDHKEPVICLQTMQNGWLASGSCDKSVKIWDCNTNQLVRTLEGHTDAVFSMRVLENGHLASCSFDDAIKIWNPFIKKRKLIRTITGHGIRTNAIEMGLLSSGLLVTCSNEQNQSNTIRLWNPKGGRLINSIRMDSRPHTASSLLVLSNDELAVGFQNGSVEIMSFKGDVAVSRVYLQHLGEIRSMFQLSNGLLATGGVFPSRSIKIWSLEDGRLVRATPAEDTQGVHCFATSQCGNYLASGSSDQTIKIWSLTNAQSVKTEHI